MDNLESLSDIFDLEKLKTNVAENHLAMLTNSPAIILIIDPAKQKIVYANPAARQFYGYSIEELRGKNLIEIVVLSTEQISKQIAHVLKGKNYQVSLKHRIANGDVRDVEIQASPMTIDGKKLLFAIVFDITESTQATEALKQNEEKFRAIFEDSGEAIFLTDDDGKILDVNHSMIRSLQYNQAELAEMDIADIFLVQQDYQRLWSHLKQSQSLRNFDTQLKAKDDTVIEARITSTARKNAANKLIGYQFIWRDITEMKRGERELEAMASNLTQVLRGVSNRADMLPIIMDKLQSIANIDGGALILEHPLSGEFIIEAAQGAWKDWLQTPKIITEEITLQTIKTEQIYLNFQALTDNPFSEPELLNGLNAIVCIPLFSQDGAFGVLWVGARDTFSEEIIRKVRFLVNIAANGIHQITLTEDKLRVLQETEAIAEIGRTFNETFDLEIIFKQIVKAVVEIIPNVDRGIIHLFDEKKERLYSVAVYSADPKASPIKFPRLTVLPNGEFNFADLQEEARHTSRMRERRGIAGYVIAEGKTITVNNVETDPRYLESNTTSDIRSMVVVPVMNGDKRLGTISAVSTVPNIFSKKDEQLLEKLGVQATTAIENARLYEAERVQRELAEAQAESSAILNRTLELNQVLEHILQQTMRAVPCKAVNIKLLGESNVIETHYRRYITPTDREFEKDSPATPLSAEAPLIQAMLASREPLIVENTESDPRWVANPKYDWIRSYVGIPLTLGNQIIGFLNVDSDQPYAFSQETVHRLKSFADNAAIAIQNARLYNILEEALKQEKSTRAQLLQSDKLAGMGRMVASVAHELNNPLQTIKNCLFLIDQNYADDTDAELLNMALSEVERLSDIVARLREVYRPQQQDLIQPIKLKHLMADVQMLLETHLRRSRVQLQQISPEEDYMVMGIVDQLKQVFLNLSLNAIEAMQPEGGQLKIEFLHDKSKREIGVAFKDTGPGIPANNLQKVFDPFFTTKETGMGLGLSICYDIAQNHNGRITVESKSDTGATFTVWLPLISADDPVNQAI